jgi:hypothetical protein
VNLFIGMSEFYHDYYRWPLRDKRVFAQWRHNSQWGRLFDRYAAAPLGQRTITDAQANVGS